MAPTFSVLIPAYQAGRWIATALESVLAQTRTDWELIVVDDGSTDDTRAVVRRFTDPRITLLSQPNSGQSAAQNRGLAHSQGTHVLFLDADDRLRPDALEHLHAALLRCPECALAYADGTYLRADGSLFAPQARAKLARKPSGDVLCEILKRNFVGYLGAALMRRLALDQSGGFSPEIRMAQDWELLCRLALTGPFAYAGPKVVYEYRLHGDSVARTDGMLPENQGKAIAAVFSNAAIRARVAPARLRRLERRRWADAALFAAVELLRAGRTRDARLQLRRCLTANPLDRRALLLAAPMLLPRLPRALQARLGIPPA